MVCSHSAVQGAGAGLGWVWDGGAIPGVRLDCGQRAEVWPGRVRALLLSLQEGERSPGELCVIPGSAERTLPLPRLPAGKHKLGRDVPAAGLGHPGPRAPSSCSHPSTAVNRAQPGLDLQTRFPLSSPSFSQFFAFNLIFEPRVCNA